MSAPVCQSTDWNTVGADSIAAQTKMTPVAMASGHDVCSRRRTANAAAAIHAMITAAGTTRAAAGPKDSMALMAKVKAKRPDQARYIVACDRQNPSDFIAAAVQKSSAIQREYEPRIA